MIILLFLLYAVFNTGDPILLSQIVDENPSGFNIVDPYPSAFSPAVQYKLEFPDSAVVKIDIFQRNNHLIGFQKTLKPGVYSVRWNLNDSQGERVSSGVYTIKFEIISTTRETKLTHTHVLPLAL